MARRPARWPHSTAREGVFRGLESSLPRFFSGAPGNRMLFGIHYGQAASTGWHYDGPGAPSRSSPMTWVRRGFACWTGPTSGRRRDLHRHVHEGPPHETSTAPTASQAGTPAAALARGRGTPPSPVGFTHFDGVNLLRGRGRRARHRAVAHGRDAGGDAVGARHRARRRRRATRATSSPPTTSCSSPPSTIEHGAEPWRIAPAAKPPPAERTTDRAIAASGRAELPGPRGSSVRLARRRR